MSAVSTIIPTHNYGHYLGEALDSIAAQRLKPAEVIVVDDGSTDDTAQVVQARSESLPGLVYMKQEQRGAPAARNAGAARAAGDILHFLDADNALLPDFYLHLVNVLGQEPSLAAACCQRFYRYGDSARRYAADRCWARELPLARAMEIDNPFDTSTTLVRRAVFEALGGFNEAFPIVQDVEFAFRLVACAPVEVSPERHVLYRLHGGGISNTDVGTHIERLLRAEAVAAADRDTYAALADTYLQYWLAVLLEQAGRLDEAEARLERLFAASPRHPAGRLLRVRLLLAQGATDAATDAATAEAEAVHAHFPDCACVVAALGRVRGAAGEANEALDLLRRAIGLELDEVERQRHRLDLADVLARAGDVAGAAAIFSEVLDEAEAPDVRPRALAGLAFLWTASGDTERAAALIEAEVEADEATALRAAYNLASQLEAAGYGEEAIEGFERVAASPCAGPAGLAAGAHYHLGSLYAAAGDGARARACLDECLRLNPAHRRAAEVLEQLADELPQEP